MKNFALFLFAVLFFFACSDGVEAPYEYNYGFQTINNTAPQWGDELKIELELVNKAGGLELEDERYDFYSIADWDTDPEGNLFTLIRTQHRINKYDRDGNYITR